MSDDTERLDNLGNLTGPGIELKDAFFLRADQFNASAVPTASCAISGPTPRKPWMRRIVDGLRNFLPIPRPEWT